MKEGTRVTRRVRAKLAERQEAFDKLPIQEKASRTRPGSLNRHK